MADILSFLKGIGSAITSLIDFLISFVSDVVYICELCGQFVLNIPAYFSWLPAEAVAIIVTIFAVVVIYKIAGREG